MADLVADDEPIVVPVLPVKQPIGEFYIGVMKSSDLVSISYADIRQIERDLDNYLGIQRKLVPSRVEEISKYVKSSDATFPTSIILAISGANVSFEKNETELSIFPTKETPRRKIAKILDGQHRVEGLGASPNVKFDVPVTIFIDADMADQANIFATVNLAQTKVNRSLAYDLQDYAVSRSPQKTAHNIAVALDRYKDSPFFQRIKRLGLATPGRTREPLTQATVVDPLIDLMSSEPMGDRDILMRGKRLPAPSAEQLRGRPFMGLFREELDLEITKIMLAYFGAVRQKWPHAWNDLERPGNLLPRTNGYRALMRFFTTAYLHVLGQRKIGTTVEPNQFYKVFEPMSLSESEFNIENFPPGSSGEARFLSRLKDALHRVAAG